MTSAPVSTDERSKLFLNLTTTQTVCFVLFLYFIVRLPWLITLPIEQAPDEPNHFWVVHYIARHMSLPTFEVVHNTGPAAEYGALPPLGYIPHVLLTALAPDNLAPTISRLGSLIVGAAVPWVAVLLGKELFPRCRYLALALPLLAAFHPQLVFVNSYTNNDSMATALASVIIYMLIRGVKNGLSVGRTAAIGALFGILGLSKHTGLSVGPAVLSGITIAGWANTLSTVQIFTRILAFCATFIAACGWFFVHNFFEFKGDVLGTKTMYESWITILPRENGQVVHPWPRASQIGWWRYVFFDFVGLFGYMDRYMWRPVYFVYLGYFVAAITGWCNQKFRSSLTDPALEPHRNASVADPMQKETAVWMLIVAFPICNLLANLAATITNVTGPHGRYLFPSELCILALTIAGLGRLKIGKALVISLVALNLIVTAAVWICWYMPGQH
jgi:Dolichyl-phosphate-mannose-protein mannosyltransferase